MTELAIEVGERVGRVSALLELPPNARALYVLAHGAGAGMRHRFLETIATGLGGRQVGTLRYQFPYMEAGGRRPDPPGVLEATVRAAVARAAALAPGLPLVAGGKSLGGRMTSNACAKTGLTGVAGLVFLGFPLHAPGKAGVERAAHLERVDLPMLFLQGTRDALAEIALMRDVTGRLPKATLHVVEGGDHSFAVLKRAGRTEAEVVTELMDTITQWLSHERLV
ncbi:MAG TPA: alpha/beta family hydrolase [Gemmatimonadales bacterium]|nr:alpha/beta family hydrolase [Gemmatimonadales bacterium]